MADKNHIWNRIVTDLKKTAFSPEFHTWLSGVTPREISPSEAVIQVPNTPIARSLQDTFREELRTILRANLKGSPTVRFIYENAAKVLKPRDSLRQGEGLQLDHGIDRGITFADFVTADTNRLAYSSALSVVNNPSTAYNPLYLYGPLGLGKTHILHGMGNLALLKNPPVRIQYLSADQCVGCLLQLSGLETQHCLWKDDENPDFLLLDDIHQVALHQDLQHHLLTLCNEFINSPKQLVLASAYPPVNIPNLLPQLRSRLEWGLIAQIQHPGQTTREKILKKIVDKEHLSLPDNVARFLANSTNDMHTLIGYIRNLKTHASSSRAPIDITTAQRIIHMAGPSAPITIQQIQDATARYFNITIKDMLDAGRKKTFTHPRHMAIYLCKELTPASFKEIGKAFGNRHHSTVIHSYRQIRDDRDKKPDVCNDINKIQCLLF